MQSLRQITGNITKFSLRTTASIFLVFSLLSQAMASGQPLAKWSQLKTKYALIHYQNQQDLLRLRQKLHFGPGASTFFTIFSSDNDGDPIAEIKGRIDAIFERVQEILGMRKAMDPVIINLYSNQRQLHQAYKEIYGTQCRIRAWYRHKDRTIYVNINDLHEGMLAHEMAHFIIDNYLEVRPPRATAEILARYVDLHLKD